MEKIRLAGCVILKENAVLLLHRIAKDWYELPGGKIDGDESEEDAAKRELKEELSCTVTIVKKLGEKDFEDANGNVMNYVWFLATTEETPQIGEPTKYDHFKYVPIKELPYQALSPNMTNLVKELETGTVSF